MLEDPVEAADLARYWAESAIKIVVSVENGMNPDDEMSSALLAIAEALTSIAISLSRGGIP